MVAAPGPTECAVPDVRGVLMADQRQNIVRVLLYTADDLERKQYGMTGILRQLAGQVATLDVGAVEEGLCPCGSPIVQARIGRPRKWCTTCSPQRKRPGKGDAGRVVPDDERGVA